MTLESQDLWFKRENRRKNTGRGTWDHGEDQSTVVHKIGKYGGFGTLHGKIGDGAKPTGYLSSNLSVSPHLQLYALKYFTHQGTCAVVM